MKDIYNLITEEKNAFIKPVNLIEGWDWSFSDHIRKSFLYKNSQFTVKNGNRDKRPFKNIVRPILNVHYRTEGFDVKDIEIYVNNSDNYHKSLLVKKFHDKWALKHEMDTFIDDLVESYVDYGGVLVKNVDSVRPEVVNLQSIAFCDQTNLLGGPFAIRHWMNLEELRDMANKGWGNSDKGATIGIEDLIQIAEKNKENDKYKNSTPGKWIEIYEVHGALPQNWLNRKSNGEEKEKEKWVSQVQIVAFYKDKDDNDTGVTLFSAKEPELPFKFLARDKIYGRALGFGGVEELFEAQIWTNYSEVQMRELLDMASKVFFKTTDSRFKTRNNLINSETGKVFDVAEGKDINQIDTTPRSINIFTNALNQWEQHANIIGAAGEPLLGEAPTAGTPFKLYEAQLIEGKSLHLWRRGKIATFVDEIYRDWILPHLSKEIVKGDEFVAELSMEELQNVVEAIVAKEAFEFQKEKVLNGELVFPEEVEQLKQGIREGFAKGGRKKFIKILKDEFKNEPFEVRTNIAGKQKNLALLTDKVVNVLRQFISTPQIRQDPEMLKLLNVILESSGLSPIMFSPSLLSASAPMQGQGGIGPLERLGSTAAATAPAEIGT